MVEILWTISALIGFLAGSYGAWQAWIDLDALPSGNDPELYGIRLVGRQRLLAQTFRSIISGVWLLVGLALLSDGIDTIDFTIPVLALIVGNVLHTVIALSDSIVGKVLRSIQIDEEGEVRK